nr:retrotransposon Orf1 [Tanacetum cinerariifolium]
MNLEKALTDFDSRQEKRLSSPRTQLGQQQDDMIEKINLLWKTISEKLNDAAVSKFARNSMASKNIASISHIEREKLRRKGIKSPSKLFSPNHNITKEGNEEVKEVIDEEEREVVTDEEVEEILKDEEEEEEDEDGENFNSFPTMEELTHHEWLLKNPRPLWKPSNLNKISNFVGRVRSLKIFIGSFAYECEFMILEDTTSIIDRHLGEMAFGRPFIDETGLVYNKEKGTVMFKQNDEKITFKMPHTMEVFKQTRLMGLSTDSIPLSAYKENFGHGRTHYYQSLLIGDGYRQDEGDKRGIRHLMRLEKEIMNDEGEVTLYLMRRSLKVLRKFHWMIFGGRFNQLSHVSSPLLSKPGEY